MSYNIDTWKTKKLENLVIPFDAFFIHERKDWHPTPEYFPDGTVHLDMGECSQVEGLLKDGIIYVTELKLRGEGSGTNYGWILIPALKQSKGELEAVLVWEGGDSITRLIVKDGFVEESNIEL